MQRGYSTAFNRVKKKLYTDQHRCGKLSGRCNQKTWSDERLEQRFFYIYIFIYTIDFSTAYLTD